MFCNGIKLCNLFYTSLTVEDNKQRSLANYFIHNFGEIEGGLIVKQ